MSRREEAESSLRKDMFVSIIASFLKPGTNDLSAKVLNLELLAYNFHDSLNLKPCLFICRQVDADRSPSKAEYSTGSPRWRAKSPRADGAAG
jgi:hypothetical protein